MTRPLAGLLVGLVFGMLLGAAVSAHAAPADDLYRIRTALESIASSLQRCPR